MNLWGLTEPFKRLMRSKLLEYKYYDIICFVLLFYRKHTVFPRGYMMCDVMTMKISGLNVCTFVFLNVPSFSIEYSKYRHYNSDIQKFLGVLDTFLKSANGS